MDEEQRKFSNEVNSDKAKGKLNIAIGIMLISLATYIPSFLFSDFDFGFIFEVTSFIFVIIARVKLENYNSAPAKSCLIIALLSEGWLFVYDIFRFVIICLNSSYSYRYGYWFYIAEAMTFSYLSLIVYSIKALSKAIDPISNRESTDWFYETVNKENDNK